jgi:xanthine dehydrogenase YagR molybdenum-binding subunit
MRDGSELVGWGMASGVWDAFQVPITVRIRLTANGHAEVASAASDIGTGTYTIMAQVAADMLGLPLDAISVKLGDSTLPQSPVEGGSWLAASVSNGIAGRRRDPARAAAGGADPELAAGGADPADVDSRAGRLVSRRDGARGLHRRCHAAGGVGEIEREVTTNPAGDDGRATTPIPRSSSRSRSTSSSA